MTPVAGEQQRIGGDKVAEPEPMGRCDWCPDPAKHVFPIQRKLKGGKPGSVVPTGMHSRACNHHREQAEKDAANVRPSLRKK